MKNTIHILIGLFIMLMLDSCYEPMEINTDNLTKVELPLRIAGPLVDGQLLIEYDSLINFDELGGGFVNFINGNAYLAYDTVIDFYDQLSGFLNATDIDFEKITTFSQPFNMVMAVPPSKYRVRGQVPVGGQSPMDVDSAILLAVSDTFRTQYGVNSVFFDIGQQDEIRIDGLDVERDLELGNDFGIYKVEIESGRIVLGLVPTKTPIIADDSLFFAASFRYQDASNDTVISNPLSYEIMHSTGYLPDGVAIKTTLGISALKDADGNPFYKEIFISSFDTTIVIDLAGHYYEGDGTGLVSIDLKNWLEINNPIRKAIIPLPDTLSFNTTIKDLKFRRVLFNFGNRTLMQGNQDIDLDVFNVLPEALEVSGFSFFEPEIKLKLLSNLGFSARFVFDPLQFRTSSSPQEIMQAGKQLDLNMFLPGDPDDATIKVLAREDSLVIDSTTSRISDIDIFEIKGLVMGYALVINPDDEAHLPGKHNFLYLYDSEARDTMYDVQLSAQVRVPIAFRFDSISYASTIAFSLDSLGLDSMIEMTDEDKIQLNVKLWTTNFPFEFKTQFLFGANDENGDLVYIDSMFSASQIIIPSSFDGIQDSSFWSLSLDANRYENIKAMDSISIRVDFSMDDNDYFRIQKGQTLGIGYKFSIGESSVLFKMD